MNAPDHRNGVPRHVAIIMDGNGRWAQRRFLPRIAGHKAGVESVRAVVRGCLARGVEWLTLFAFSSENWRRPRREVSLLMDLFLSALNQEARRLHESGVRLKVLGDTSAFPERLQSTIGKVEALTAGNRELTLVVAANYGGRWDISRAAQRLALRVAEGSLQPEEIDEQRLHSELSTFGFPEPDLFIRTGGEQRVSNFLLWQLAYTELYFSDRLWPEFGQEEFEDALQSFKRRQRRFGRTGDQIAQTPESLKV